MSDRTTIWQGWHLQLPRRWDPVKLEGDHTQGYILFTDAMRDRLGIRWQTMNRRRRFDPESAVQHALREEVGSLAAAEARQYTFSTHQAQLHPGVKSLRGEQVSLWRFPLLYIEPKPPGRDVFCAYSPTSNRLVQIVYHAHRRERILGSTILPTLLDLPLDRAVPWSIFDLSCIIPGGMLLRSHPLNAGDLSLTFADRLAQITIRQIAVAKLALQRRPLDRWISDQQKANRRYQPIGAFSDITLQIDGRSLVGRLARMRRRLRYRLLHGRFREITTIGVHDQQRDRLLLLQGSDEALLTQTAQTIGFCQI